MLEATRINTNRWAVRPQGQLGTCGSWPYLWTVMYVTANSAEQAIRQVERRLNG